MKESLRYFDQHDIIAHSGINKIDNRSYYCYIDTNNTVVVIPRWYQWFTIVVTIVCLIMGILLSWWLL